MPSAHREVVPSMQPSPRTKRLRDLQSKAHRFEQAAVKLQQQNIYLQSELSEARNRVHETLLQLGASRDSNEFFTKRISELESVLRKEQSKAKEDSKAKLEHEIASLRSQLEMVGRQLTKAQRRVMALDQKSIFQNDLRSDSDNKAIQRCKGFSPSNPDLSGVIKLVERLNVAITQFALGFFSRDKSRRFYPPTAINSHAEALLGQPVLAILRGNVIQVFLVTWCLAIIEGWYPKRDNFFDAFSNTSKCQRVGIQIITKSADPNFPAWVIDIQRSLSDLLAIGGIWINDSSALLLPVVKAAYAIRTTLAEKDIYGNVEVFLAPLQAPFQQSCMWAVYKAYDRYLEQTDSRPWNEGYVIGNITLGLEVNEGKGQNGNSMTTATTKRVILQPQVLVSSSIDFTYNTSSAYRLEFINAVFPPSRRPLPLNNAD